MRERHYALSRFPVTSRDVHSLHPPPGSLEWEKMGTCSPHSSKMCAVRRLPEGDSLKSTRMQAECFFCAHMDSGIE